MKRVPLFWSVVTAVVVVWVCLAYVLPYAAMWVTGRDRPLPIPGAVFAIYLVLTLVGSAVYVTISDESIREFLRPLLAFLRGPEPGARPAGALRRGRLAVLLAAPPPARGGVYARALPPAQSPPSPPT